MIITAIALTLYVGYYFVSKPFLRKLSNAAARSGLPILANATIAERQATIQMSLVVAAHLIMVCFLSLLVLPRQWWLYQASHLGIQSIAVLLAVLLGVGESVASGVLAEMLYTVLGWIDKRREQLSHPSHLAVEMVEASAGGWMKTIRVSVEANLIVGVALLTLQLACEEIIFRFIFPRCLPGHMWTAGALFIIMQFSGLKRRIGGVFAAVGATVMAVSQGYLATRADFLAPLVVAHLVMFLSSRTLSNK